MHTFLRNRITQKKQPNCTMSAPIDQSTPKTEKDVVQKKPKNETEMRQQEWAGYYKHLDEFMKQDPTKHPLYQFAQQSMVQGESCDFYRGSIDDMYKVSQIINACKEVAREQQEQTGAPADWESLFIDMWKLRIGLSMHRALGTWPEKFLPDELCKEKQK